MDVGNTVFVVALMVLLLVGVVVVSAGSTSLSTSSSISPSTSVGGSSGSGSGGGSGSKGSSLTSVGQETVVLEEPAAGEGGACLTTGDVNFDAVVDQSDIDAIIAVWDLLCEDCSEDVNENGVVDFADILLVLSHWGPVPECCGNGHVEKGEMCDDGNQRNGDGCSLLCELELTDHLVVRDFSESTVPRYLVNTGNQWESEIIESTYMTAPDLAVNTAAQPGVSYFARLLSAVRFSAKTDEGWTSETVDTFIYNRHVETAVLFDADDQPVVIYPHAQGEDIRYAIKKGDSWSYEVFDELAFVVHTLDARFDDTGALHIVYAWDDVAERTGSVRYAQRTQSGTWYIEDIATARSVTDVSITVDSENNPHIVLSMEEIITSDVRYAERIGFDTWDVAQVFEISRPQYISGVSFALDSTDAPHIAFGVRGPLHVEGDTRYMVYDEDAWTTPVVLCGGEDNTHYFPSLQLRHDQPIVSTKCVGQEDEHTVMIFEHGEKDTWSGEEVIFPASSPSLVLSV